MVRAGDLAVFHFGLSHGGALVDVVQRGCVLLVCLAALEVAEEGALAHPAGTFADGGVEQGPVDRQAEATEQVFEHLLVEVGDLAAEFNEVGAAHRNGAVIFRHIAVERGGEAGVERQRRVAAHAGDILHAAFGGEAVVVPTDGVEHLLAAHALETSDGVGVGVAEHMADVQRAAHRGRRGVDGEYLGAARGAVEAVGAVGFPSLAQTGLDTVE